jgi:hypothetical protein
VETKESSRTMMRRPKEWPRRPYLPVVRQRPGELDTGVMLEGTGPCVWRVSWMQAASVGVAGASCDRFSSLERLLASGWVVD